MKGTDLEAWCKEQGSATRCSECICKKQCDKWKEMKKKLQTLEPWELDEVKKISKYLITPFQT